MSEITNEKLDAAETSNSNSSLDETVKRTKIGDIVLLKSPKIDVAGFALYKGGGILTLGFLDPNCRLQLGFDYDNLGSTGYVTKDSTDGSIKRSSRNYIIAKFPQVNIMPYHIHNAEPRTSNILSTQEYEPSANCTLEELNVGDLVLLESMKEHNVNIVGFVKQRLKHTFLLSHVDPNSEVQGSNVWGADYSRGGYGFFLGAGDKWFNAQKFASTRVIKPNGAEFLLNYDINL